MKNVFLIMLLAMGCALGSFAQQTPPPAPKTYQFSIADCINYAYEHQDSVVNAALSVKSADYKVKETIGVGLPQISGSGQFQDYLKKPVQIIDAHQFNATVPEGTLAPVNFALKYSSTLGVDINQILFSGSYIVGLQAVKTFKELAQRNYSSSKIVINVNVTKAYYQVLVSDEQVKLLDANINQLKQQLDQTIQQNKQGFVEKIDVDRLTVQYNNLTTSRENTVRSLVLNYQLLKFQMGMPIQNEIILKDKLEDIDLSKSALDASLDTSVYNNRIEYSLMQTNKKLNELDVKNKKAQFIPSLSAFGNFGTSFYENKFGNLYNNNYSSSYFGLRLSVPIFSGGQRISQVRQSQIAVLKSQNDIDNLKNALNLEASQSRVTYINGLKSLDNQKQNQQLAQEVLRVSKIKYQQGVGSSIEVTQAQTDLQNADNQYIQALYNVLISKVDLDKAYGKIN